MKHQQGAALVIVMALLSGALMLGMSGMQSALIDERLAGNYRATTQAQMTAENIVSELAADENKTAREDYLKDRVKEVNNNEGSGNITILRGREINELLSEGKTLNDFVEDLIPEELKNDPDAQDQVDVIRKNLLENLVVDIDIDTKSQTVTITARDEGLRNSALRSASIIYGYSFNNQNNKKEIGLVSCSGISFEGGTQNGYTIDAFDSRLGAYGIKGNFGEKASIFSLKDNSTIKLGSGPNYTGFTGFEADFFSAGDIEITNNNPVSGSFYAGGGINFAGNSFLLTGNAYAAGEIEFKVGARVDGDVVSNKKIEVLGNWGVVNAFQPDSTTRSGTSFAIGGDVTAPIIYTKIGNRIEGEQRQEAPNFIFEKSFDADLNVVSDNEKCPSYGVYEEYEKFKHSSNPQNMYIGRDERIVRTSELEGIEEVDSFDVIHVNELNIGKKGLIVENPTVIVAESNVNITLWNNSKIALSEGASLKIITKGKAVLTGSNIIDSQDAWVDGSGNAIPAYSLVSLFDGDSGVVFNSDGDMYLEVIAPFSEATISGSSRLLGHVVADEINVSGGGSLHYDLAYGARGTGEGGAAGSGGDWVWELINWR